MSKTANELLRATSRTDSVKKVGDMFTGDGNAVPSRDPVLLPLTLGDPNARAPIVGDMVTGMPRNDQLPTPDVPPIEKLSDTSAALPAPDRQL